MSQQITLGIGTPSDIPQFLLLGLSTNENVPDPVAEYTIMVPARARTVVVPANARVIR